MATRKPSKTVRYHVQEFAGGQWFTLKGFDTRAEAESWLGAPTLKTRIKEVRI